MSRATLSYKEKGEKKKTAIALAVSILFHLILIITLAFLLSKTFFDRELAPEVDDEPVELTIISPEPEPPKAQYVDSSDAVPADKPPEKPAFESDRDTQASSPLPATGTDPLPTQEGEEVAGLNFTNREDSLGPQSRPSAPIPPSPPTQPTQPAQPKDPAQASEPEPAATPEPTPKPEITPRQTTQLALLEPPKPQSTPKPETQKPAQTQDAPPQPTPPAPPTQPTQPAQPAQPPGYQPQTRVTRLRGNLSNRGRASVAAQATPLGRYNKMVSDAVGSRWYYYVRQQMSVLVPGTVEIRFTITKEGKASKVQVLRNSSNESFAACSVGSIVDAEIPPIPPEIVPMLQGGSLEIDFTFAIY